MRIEGRQDPGLEEDPPKPHEDKMRAGPEHGKDFSMDQNHVNGDARHSYSSV